MVHENLVLPLLNGLNGPVRIEPWGIHTPERCSRRAELDAFSAWAASRRLRR